MLVHVNFILSRASFDKNSLSCHPCASPHPFLNRKSSVDNSWEKAWRAEFKIFLEKSTFAFGSRGRLDGNLSEDLHFELEKVFWTEVHNHPRECFHKNSEPKQCFSTISMPKNIYIDVSNLPLWSFLRIYPEKKFAAMLSHEVKRFEKIWGWYWIRVRQSPGWRPGHLTSSEKRNCEGGNSISQSDKKIIIFFVFLLLN